MTLFSHVDVRVRDRDRARAFYDALLAPLGATREDGAQFTTYQIVPPGADPATVSEWFGFTVDEGAQPNANRIAFAVATRADVDRVARLLPSIGALEIEGDDGEYGPEYYAVFFTDPDGNALEVCCVGETARVSSA